jgi:hypothetical protein
LPSAMAAPAVSARALAATVVLRNVFMVSPLVG